MSVRNTRKTIDARLKVFADVYHLKCQLNPYQPDKYIRYELNVKKFTPDDWEKITNYLNTSEMIEFLNSAIRLKTYFNNHIEAIASMFG
jgi:hypothetical protein